MRNPLDVMKIRSNLSKNVLSRERSETHNIYGKAIRPQVAPSLPHDHSGWDLIASEKTPIYAIKDGAVVMARQESSYGNQIEIEFSENGKTYRAFYAHLSAISVSLFQVVKEGQVIGSTGHTGNANNLPLAQRHLHFEIRTDGGAGKHGSIDPSILLGGDILICHQ